jgi:hypothetical protein
MSKWKQSPKPDLKMNRREVETLSYDRSENLKGTVQTRPVTRSSKPLSKGLSKNKAQPLSKELK